MSQNSNATIYTIPESDLYKIDTLELSPEGGAAALYFKRRDRFVEGSDYQTDLIRLLNKFFGDIGLISETGLDKQYRLLKTEVETNNIIGLILSGVNIHNILINNYMLQDKVTIIKLTIASLCRGLLRNHFTELEVNTLAQATPNFDLYFEHTKSNTYSPSTHINPATSNSSTDSFGRFHVNTFTASPPRSRNRTQMSPGATENLD